ncbi:MAG: hypothetical protein ACRC2R_16845 [Xenococcaceae cyanobacterium]
MTMPLSALGATVDYTTSADPELRIKFSAIKDVLSWSTAPTSAGTQDLDPWIASIIQKLADWNSATSTQTHDVVVGQPLPGVQSRNNIDNRPTYSYSATVFSKTPVAVKPDADDLQE